MSEHNDVHVESKFGDMQVIVLMPSAYSQSAYSFRPSASGDGLHNVARRDLLIIRAMLQDALDDIDDERRRRWEQAPATIAPAPMPAPSVWRPLQ